MSGRLHEIIAQIAVLHDELLNNNKITNANEVLKIIKEYEVDIKKHYLNLLLQYYFQKNDLKNLKVILLEKAKFDMRFEDVKEAFLNIKSSAKNVIEFMQENVIFVKEGDFNSELKEIYEYYISNKELQKSLDLALELIKRNRYVCAYCYKNSDLIYSKFFLNPDLLESLKRDLPHLLNK